MVAPQGPAAASAPGYNGLIALSTSAGSSSGGSSIWTMRADGSGLRELTKGSTPSWSPDGKHIAFSDANLDKGIWVIGAGGANLTQLSTGSDWSPTWSPDGSKIAFARFTEHAGGADDYDIWVMDSDGSDQQHLGGWSGSWETFPTWSPDGSRIAFASDRFYVRKSEGIGDIFVMDANGSDVSRLTRHTAGDGFPDWSPDGTKILFTRRSDPHLAAQELYTVAPDGTGVELLTEFVNVGQASWSPEGEHIVVNGGYSSDLYRIRGDGRGAPVQLTSLRLSDDKYSDWQPVATKPSSAGEFTSLTPARILDTRTGNGRNGATTPLGATASFAVQITGRGGVAADGVSAVVMNVTVTQPTAPSYLTVWPTDVDRPLVSNLNYVAGQTVPNLVTVAVGAGGRVSAFNRFGSVHVIFDVVGFYADRSGPAGSRFHSIDDPFRYFDTRTGLGGVGVGPVGPDESLQFGVLGRGGVPGVGVSGVVMNVTVTQPTQPSYLTVYPNDVATPPLASNLNYVAGLTVPNLVVVRVPPSGIVNFYNRHGSVHVLADVVGYFDDDRFGEAGRFVGLNPSRHFDSREMLDEPICEDCGLTLAIVGWAGVPVVGARAAVLNVTATEPTAPSYTTVFPDDLCYLPLASNLNYVPGQSVPNHVVVRLSSPTGCANPDFPGAIILYNRFGTVHLIVDVFGYFTDDAAYARYVTITDDTGAISVDVPIEWNDVFGEPRGDPPEPLLVASPDLRLFATVWDVPGVVIEASRRAATAYPTPADWLASFELDHLDQCATIETGPYDDGDYLGTYVSATRCGAGGAGDFLVVAQARGVDHFVRIEFSTITPRDVEAMAVILASLDVSSWS